MRSLTLLPLLFLVSLSCSPFAADCDLDTTAADLAGDGATLCGAAGEQVGEAEWACALDAWNAGARFVLRYASTGTDSVVEGAWVYDGSRLWILAQDQYGAGPWDIDGTECIDPLIEQDEAGFDVLGCTSTEPAGNHYQVCGEICADCGEPDPLPFEP